MKTDTFFGRTTSFVALLLVGINAAAAGAEASGRWLFVDDGSGIEIAPCPTAVNGLCGTLVQLPRNASPMKSGDRKKVCGATILGSLKATKHRPGELVRLDGWVIDPEDLLQPAPARRYSASLVLISEGRARLDVRGPFDTVAESHTLLRPVVPGPTCE